MTTLEFAQESQARLGFIVVFFLAPAWKGMATDQAWGKELGQRIICERLATKSEKKAQLDLYRDLIAKPLGLKGAARCAASRSMDHED